MTTIVLTTTHPTPCVDLRTTFAGQFRFAWDPSYEAERPDRRAIEAPWLTVIPGKHGKIFPWGGRLLAAYSNTRGVRTVLEALEGATVRQGGGECREVIVSFDVDLIETVAAILGSKRPRTPPTPEQRTAIIERTRAFRFKRGRPGENSTSTTPDSTNAPADEDQAGRITPSAPGPPKVEASAVVSRNSTHTYAS